MIRWGKRFLKITAVLFMLLLLLAAAMFFLPQLFLCRDSGPAKADVIIVLGGGTHERSERAAELFHQHAAPRILVSGYGDDGMNEYQLMKDGVPRADIQLEGKSRTTRQNAQFSYNILKAEKVHSAIIVTSWYHSRRALKTFEHFAPGIQFYSRPSYFDYKRRDWDREFARHVYWEYIKLPGYWVGYGVCPF